MTLEKHIENYINNPFPLWNNELTKLLVENKWEELSSNYNPKNSYEYSIAGCIHNIGSQTEISIPICESVSGMKLVLPSIIPEQFYEKHGLELAKIDNTSVVEIIKVKSALAVLQQDPEVYFFINTILKSVQILKSEDSETDISYSHPDIPFSIFFSVCEEHSLISDLRVAESILHEAMHLYLTLIENRVPLIELNTKEVYFSPWRDEERPVKGVLHGLFVFRAILYFYSKILKNIFSNEVEEFLRRRINEINTEINLLNNFPKAIGLTMKGKKMSTMLLK